MNLSHKQRMDLFVKAGLYFVTSQALSGKRTTLEVLQAVLDAGVKLVQLREKELDPAGFLALAEKARALTDQYGALLIINDNLDAARSVGADGVHLGQDDFPVAQARCREKEMIIGSSSHSLAEAMAAEKAGASYVNIGPIFATRTKAWGGEFLGVEAVRAIGPHLSVPFTVMGGIKKEHVPELKAAGAKTMAVVTAITAADNPGREAREWLALLS
jgi:thiamine-phosphate pyrophosphorylase